MSRRGSEKRRKIHPVMVRLSETEYLQLTEGAEREGATRAEYLRRRLNEISAAGCGASSETGNSRFSEIDRILLAGLIRTMGHLGGLMKLAVMKTPSAAKPSVRSFLEKYHSQLLQLQGQVRALPERAS